MIIKDYAKGVPICGITAMNGAGKTLLGVTICIAKMLEGRTVYSTVDIEYVHPATGVVYRSEPVLSLEQLLHLRGVTVFFDDVSAILPSGNINLPEEIVTLLQTLRHSDIDVLWSAPGWMRANNGLRLITQGLLNVIPVVKRHNKDTPWPTPVVNFVVLYDTGLGKPDAVPTRVLARHVVFPKKLAGWGAYDTLADVPLLRASKRSSICEACGGREDTPKHSEDRHRMLGIPFYDRDEDLRRRRPEVARKPHPPHNES